MDKPTYHTDKELEKLLNDVDSDFFDNELSDVKEF